MDVYYAPYEKKTLVLGKNKGFGSAIYTLSRVNNVSGFNCTR